MTQYFLIVFMNARRITVRIVCIPLIVILLLDLSATDCRAQTAADSVKPQSTATTYKFAAGFRKAVSGEDETSLSGKYFITSKAVLHLTAGRVYGPGRSAVSASYERYRPFFHSSTLRYGYGAGLSTLLVRPAADAAYQRTRALLAANFILCLEYTCKTLPLAFSADGRALFRIAGTVYPGQRRESLGNIGLAAHYLLKRRR